MGTASARTRIFWDLSLSLRARMGGLGALLLVCVRACGDSHVGRITERRSGGTERPREATPEREREARTAKEGRESPRSDEEVIESHPRSRIPLLKFDSTSSSCGESSMSGKTKGKEDKDHATKGQ